MKSFKLFFSFLLFACIAIPSTATQMTAIVNGGDWSDPATWSGGRVPGNNDTLTIPAGIQVVVDINSPVYVNFCVHVFGELNFDVGQKINMCPGSVILYPGGSFTGGVGGSKINECGNTVWNGPGPTTTPGTYGNSTLPVELVLFTGEKQGQVVLLNWETATENNCSYFTIERSTNGLTFEDIGRVTGNGTSTQPHAYTLTDQRPENGTNYYRLSETDGNGMVHQFNTVAVSFETEISDCVLSVFPNPCEGNCTISFSDCPSDNGVITIQMIDASGKIVYSTVPQRDTRGGFTTSIDASNNLKPGVYIVRGVSSKGVYQQRAVLK
jgi:hypothetical protein